jgi:hypothetical protein
MLDPTWQSGEIFETRRQAYKWLAKVLGLPIKKAHIGMLDKAQCSVLLDKLELLVSNHRD